jgi:hypothetical protein
LAGDFVLDKERGRTGIIKTVNEVEKTAMVCWVENNSEEEISVYCVVKHSHRRFRLGGFVLSSTNNDVGEVLYGNGETKRVAWSSSDAITVEFPGNLNTVDMDEERKAMLVYFELLLI